MFLTFIVSGAQADKLIKFLNIDPVHPDNDLNTKVCFKLGDDHKTVLGAIEI